MITIIKLPFHTAYSRDAKVRPEAPVAGVQGQKTGSTFRRNLAADWLQIQPLAIEHANEGCGRGLLTGRKSRERSMNRAGKWIWLVLLAQAASPCCGADLSAEQVR